LDTIRVIQPYRLFSVCRPTEDWTTNYLPLRYSCACIIGVSEIHCGSLTWLRYSLVKVVLIIKKQYLMKKGGRATAQAVSRWLPIAAAQVQFQVRSCGICGRQSGTGAGFLRVLRFANPHSTDCSIIIIRGWYNRSTVADVPSGLSLTPPRETKKKLMKKGRYEIRNNLLLSFLRHGPHRKRRVQEFFYYMCICCRGNVFTEPLPSNEKGIHIETH
jgi:hypothetical protein